MDFKGALSYQSSPAGENAIETLSVSEDKRRRNTKSLSEAPVRVVVVDDHEVVLEGLISLVRRESGMELVGASRTGEDAVRRIRELQPDVVILDLSLPDISGLDVLRQLEGTPSAVVLFTASATQDELLEAMRLGVRGVVLKEMPSHLLIECVRKVGRGGEWLEKRSVGKILHRLLAGADSEREQMHQMTEREREVIRLVCRGLRNREIAEELNLSVSTIKVHLYNVFGKLDVRNRAELILWARKRGCES